MHLNTPERLRAAMPAGLLIVLGTLATLPCAAADSAAALRQAIAACRPIVDVTTRAACYDRVADSSGAVAPQAKPTVSLAAPKTAEAAVDVPMPPRQAAAPDETASLVLQEEKQVSEEEFGREPERRPQITVEVARIAYNDDRRLRFTTAAGISWDQTDQTAVRWPKVGDKVLIKATMIGGHRCRVGRHWMNCKRVH